jgi:hypothetical protein
MGGGGYEVTVYARARGLTNVAADGRDQVVGLCMFRVESPAAELGR